VIGATFYGTSGALSVANVDGSFYDFTLDHHRGTSTTRLVDPPMRGADAPQRWADRLADGGTVRPRRARARRAGQALDRIYGR
jgi:hypothetical protein